MTVFTDPGRARSLVRDEHSLRAALARHEDHQFDVEALLGLRVRVLDLLQTVDLIAADDEFWNMLSNQEYMSKDAGVRLSNLNAFGFAAMLEAVGYKAPPSAGELVDDTIESVVRAVENSAHTPVPAQLEQARFNLRSLSFRARRDVAASIEQQDPRRLRVAARSASKAARALIPPAIAVAATGLIELALPGTGLVVVLGAAAAQELVAVLTRNAAEMLAGNPVLAQDAGLSVDESESVDPVRVHTAALADSLNTLSKTEGERSSEADDRRHRAIGDAMRHLRRLNDLVQDLQPLPPAWQLPELLTDIDELLDSIDGARARDIDQAMPEVVLAARHLTSFARYPGFRARAADSWHVALQQYLNERNPGIGR